jgi:hypothetical protein
MDVEQKRWLAGRLRQEARRDKRWPALSKLLLSMGGYAVLPVREPRWYMTRILSDGILMSTKRCVLKRMVSSQCHQNACDLYELGGVLLATGWALSGDDGIWRRHSWALKPSGCIIETTEKRVAYFGVVLTPSESERMVQEEMG